MAKDKEKIIIKLVREIATNDSTCGTICIDLPDGKTFKALTLERKTRTFARVANPRISCCIQANKRFGAEKTDGEEDKPRKLKTKFIGDNPFCLSLSNKYTPLFCAPCRFDDVSVSQICVGSEHKSNYEMGGNSAAFETLERLAKKWSLEYYEFYLDIDESNITYVDESYNAIQFAMMMGEEIDDDEEDYNFINNDIDDDLDE